MRTINIKSSISMLLLIISTVSVAQEKLLISGCYWDKVAIVDKQTQQIEWTHQLKKGDECNDAEVTKSGDILFAYKRGAMLVNRKNEVLWDFQVKKGQELFTATELPSGNFLLAVCANPSRIITLNSKGIKINEQNFDTGIEKVHSQFRQVLPTAHNTYIIPLMGKGEVIELSQSSDVLKRIEVGSNPFSVKIMSDGNWLVACGDAHKLALIDPQKEKVIKSISDQDIADVKLLFVAEPHLTDKGNIMIANWNGHSKDKSQAKLLEINPDNRVVWTLKPTAEIANISTIYLFNESP